METNEVSTEWAEHGTQVISWAKAYSRKVSRKWARPSDLESIDEYSAHGVLRGYQRYLRWREKHDLDERGPAPVIRRCVEMGVRDAIRSEMHVDDASRGSRSVSADNAEYSCNEWTDSESPESDDRLVRVISRLPERLQPVALVLVGCTSGQLNSYELADRIGKSERTASRAMAELADHPVIRDLLFSVFTERALTD